MTEKNQNYLLHCALILYIDSDSPLTVCAISLALTKQADKAIECRLTFRVNSELYQQIDREALFNLRPEVRGPFTAKGFSPDQDIEIEAVLEPDLLPQLTEHAADASQVATYLQKLSQEQPDNPLLSTYSWYALQVKQQQATSEIGYRTFWAYVSPSTFTQNGISSDRLSEGMARFIEEWTESSQVGAFQENLSEMVETMTTAFEAMTGNLSQLTEKTVAEALETITSSFEELSEGISEVIQTATTKPTILEEITNFFTAEDWAFIPFERESLLQLAFEGKHGIWTCHAHAREEQQQLIFYSICPLNAPEIKWLAIAEFLTRANYGLLIGNFEMDFSNGEIRYKTSIDVKNGLLSAALIKQVIYTNVMMMDKYLPGIKLVVEGNQSPVGAIAQVEG